MIQRTELEQEMVNRVRRHMLTAFAGVGVAILLVFAAGAGSYAIFGSHPPIFVAMLPVLGILLIPVIGLWSTFRNLRCPSCNRLVAFQVSNNYSLFGRFASKNCAGCGQKIFADDIARRLFRVIIVLFAIGMALAITSAILSAVLAPH